MPCKTEIIRTLNDDFRRTFSGGQVLITPGVQDCGSDSIPEILKLVQCFSDFNVDNDPYHEHDFGKFEYRGDVLFWRIDYYDRDCRYGSEDPANAKNTTRVLTIMLSSEY